MLDLLFKIIIGIISFVIVYFIFRRVNKKNNPLKNWKFYLVWIITWIVLFLIISISMVSFLFYKYSPDYENRAFNSTEWKSNPEIRGEMVDDLLDNVIKNKNREEIIQLLGNETEGSNPNNNVLVYYIGPERGFISIDGAFLYLYFENNKLTKKQIISG